ncbi:hypothetical protein CALVIDRAFT_267551 [Calocera viscosa TUFC12733]|uniref:Peptidase C14 caspase domain-containing protein n=1 Tax=Calocera viscosa (strain TUFC12733) TaxID=1330018 RepID=A0A167IYB5_CALVF|nr:hypothetical protein CALVIDRAFT_267551 [Calocera viscosa TUFC12733]
MCPTTAYVEPPPTYWHALLIAIAYSEHEDHRARLVEPHGDVDKIRRFLLRRGWLDENIVILSDEKPAGDDSQDGSQEGEERGYPEPTKENILKALVDLIQPAVDNPAQSHKFFFYYAGHGAQEVDLTGEEDDGWNECTLPAPLLSSSAIPGPHSCRICTGIVPLRSQVLTALHIEEPPLPQASQTRPSTPLPPLPPPPPPPPPQRAHPVRRQSAKIKFLPSDCPFDMELVGRRRGALSPALSPAQAGSGFGTGTDGEMNSEQGASEGERLLPMTTEDHGWINDDTLCDLLCRRLPATCRLIAFFDMCHSGTALGTSILLLPSKAI